MEKGNIIAQGATAEIFEWGNSDILKLYRKGFSDHDVEKEYRISRTIHSSGLPTPSAKDMVTVDGRKGIIYERINGHTMLRQIASKPWSVIREAQKLADLHYSVHGYSVKELPDVKTKLKDFINWTDLLTEEKKKLIVEYLYTLEDGNNLCHGDFHPDNVLTCESKSIIIDWMTAVTGSKAYDVARTCLLFSTSEMPPGTPKLAVLLLSFVRKMILKAYIHRYLKISGLSMKQVDKWILPTAAARLLERRPKGEVEKLMKIIDERLAALNKLGGY